MSSASRTADHRARADLNHPIMHGLHVVASLPDPAPTPREAAAAETRRAAAAILDHATAEFGALSRNHDAVKLYQHRALDEDGQPEFDAVGDPKWYYRSGSPAYAEAEKALAAAQSTHRRAVYAENVAHDQADEARWVEFRERWDVLCVGPLAFALADLRSATAALRPEDGGAFYMQNDIADALKNVTDALGLSFPAVHDMSVLSKSDAATLAGASMILLTRVLARARKLRPGKWLPLWVQQLPRAIEALKFATASFDGRLS